MIASSTSILYAQFKDLRAPYVGSRHLNVPTPINAHWWAADVYLNLALDETPAEFHEL